jgi:GNAT superfamily N-acetyltransferase
MSITRVATKADLPEVLKLTHAFFDSSEWARDTTFDEDGVSLTLWGLVEDPRNNLFVIETESVVPGAPIVVGALGVYITKYPFTKEQVATELFWYIRPDFRGTRLAIDMFIMAEQWAKAQGARMMLMGALVTSPPAVRTLYTQFGYNESQTGYIKRIN